MLHELAACVAMFAGTYCGVLEDPDPLPAPPEPMSVTVQETRIAPSYLAGMAASRAARARALIEDRWKDTPHVETMLRIACREAGLGKSRGGSCAPGQRDYDWRGPTADAQACAADNPSSSAAGLFQTIGMHRRLAEGIGLSWANVAGPDCLDDIVLAWQLYDGGRGLRNWNATR
jgi:hypothetical protein